MPCKGSTFRLTLEDYIPGSVATGVITSLEDTILAVPRQSLFRIQKDLLSIHPYFPSIQTARHPLLATVLILLKRVLIPQQISTHW